MFETILGVVGSGLVGAVAWIFHLGNRVSVIETKHEDLLILINEKFDAIKDRLDRIDIKL